MTSSGDRGAIGADERPVVEADGASAIDADDLAMLAEGFEAAMLAEPGAGAADAALFELGWAELLAAAPTPAVTTAFGLLGSTGSAAALLDDVVVQALGLEPSLDRCVVHPVPDQSAPPGASGSPSPSGRRTIDGLVSGRVDRACTALVACDDGSFGTVDIGLLRSPAVAALDTAGTFRRVRIELDDGAVTPVEVGADWTVAVAAARRALAHQLIGAARTMLEQARRHALDREQFGRPVASFQAVRHKLAESLVAIEGAEAVADVCTSGGDPLTATLAKSLAGSAARTTATHAQQVLAGIGFTTDHPFQQWLKRTLVLDTLYGSSSSLPTEIGNELLARGAAPRLIEL